VLLSLAQFLPFQMAKTWNRVFSLCGIGTYHPFVDLNKLDRGNSGAVVVSRSKRHVQAAA
jgi:hypothetical protein